MKRALAFAAAIFAPASLVLADQLPFTYVYTSSPSGGYPDSGGELNDGVANSVAWDGVATITPAHVAPLVGWDGVNPVVTLTFASPVTITSVVAWFADSNGAAAVALPTGITLSDGAGFSQVFGVTDPAGAGSTVPLLLDGFSLTTSTLTLDAQRVTLGGYHWTMASEIQVFGTTAIPEPTTYASALGILALVTVGLRRRRR
ncbi:MAG: hypothetical protein H7067_14255 [Burkholderiales bacterium]|nr:hypothetical protein [Opitutaceae bacterium]